MIIVTEVVKIMHSNRVLRTSILSIILVLSSLLPSLIITPVISADSVIGDTTFYFKDVTSTDIESEFDFGTPVSLEKPTKKTNSVYPPKIIKLNTSKTSEEMQYWFLTWSLYLLSELDENISEEFGDFGDLLEGLEILFPNPFRIVGSFSNNGNETLEINGDVDFNLFFTYFRSQGVLSRLKDEVKVGLYTVGDFLPTEIKNKTVTIKTGSIIKNGITQQMISLENVNFYLQPGKTLLFSIEIVQKDKLIFNIIKNIINEEKLINKLKNIGNKLENVSKSQKLQDLGTIIKEFTPILEEFNFSLDDIDEVINTFRSSSIVYDSAKHPSSVNLNIRLPEEPENSIVYYLHEENTMDEIKPLDNNTKTISISKDPLVWNGPNLDRNKILKDATAKLYINHKDLLLRLINIIMGKIKITAEMNVNGSTIATSENTLGRTFFNLFGKPEIPIKFNFNFSDGEEIVYGESISIEFTSNIGNRFTGFGLTRGAKLFYDSIKYPSSLSLEFDDTDHIKLDTTAEPYNEEIVPGGSVKYKLNISSRFDDKITVEVKENNSDDWNLVITKDQIDIPADKTAETYLFVNSTDDKKGSYGESIDFTIVVSGKTGIARRKTTVEISEDAIDYNVNIVEYTKSKSIKKGNSGTFYFIIKNNNTGAVDDVDSYEFEAESKNGWSVRTTDIVENLKIGEKSGANEIIIVVTVPKNTTKSSDTITFNVVSTNNPKTSAMVNVTVEVISASLIQNIYDFFESTSNSIGFDEIFGSYGPHALAALIVIIILIIIIILLYFITKKVLNIICEERIKEIDPNEQANFKILIENPTKKNKIYEIKVINNPPSENWEKSLDTKQISIDGKQSKIVILTVKPTDKAKPNDWTETKIVVNMSGKRKSDQITIMTMLKDGKTILKISDVFTWPKSFIQGNRITTSFKLFNKGNITARNVIVKLFINGREKNKTEVTIPSGGYAEIRIPWIAQKGKNSLYLKAIEQ